MARTRNILSFIKNTSFLWRIFAFFVLFLTISGTIGPLIINNSLVGKYGFGIYGGSGKALIFAGITLGILAYRSRHHVKLVPWHWRSLLWVIPLAAAFALSWIAVSQLIAGQHAFYWPVLAHIGMLASVACAAFASLGVTNLRNIYRAYRTEILISLAIGVGFFVFLTIVYGLWGYLSTAVMYGVSWLLNLVGVHASMLPSRILLLDKFAVEISQWCSGIESIALFTGFYIIVGIADRDKLNFRKYAAVFLPALIVLFGLNILRVFLLILAAIYVDTHIAFSLFHTYAGMIIFLIYTAIFWRLTYGWMLKKDMHKSTTKNT